MEIYSEIIINGSPHQIWQVLVGTTKYAEWNPFIVLVEGELKKGAKVNVHNKLPNGKAFRFRPTILKILPEKELRWKGRFILPGVFDGEHFFQLEALGPTQTKLIHGERFSGVLIPFFRHMLKNQIEEGFLQMNKALKKRVEAKNPSSSSKARKEKVVKKK